MPPNLCLPSCADDIFHWQQIIILHSTRMWSLNTYASPPTTCTTIQSDIPIFFFLLHQWCRITVINSHFSLGSAEWKEKNKRRAPQSRQHVTKVPEQSTVLSGHPDKVPKTQHWGRVEFSNETHHTLQWLLVNSATLSMPKIRYNTMSSLAPMQFYFQFCQSQLCKASVVSLKKKKIV